MKSDVIGMLAALETSLNASTSSQVVRQQLKFCTTWTLDNVCTQSASFRIVLSRFSRFSACSCDAGTIS